MFQHPAEEPNSVALVSKEDRSLFLGDLSLFCQEADIFQLFQGCGEIEAIRLMRNKSGTKCLGYGFITFVDVSSIPLAMQRQGSLLIGRKIR